MATITKRGNLQWQAKVRMRGHPSQTRTFTSRANAEQWARQVEHEIERGIFVDRTEAEATTLRDALDRYEREITTGKDGAQQERTRIRKWKEHPLAPRSLASLRGADFAKVRDERLKTVAPSTVQKDMAVISHLFTIAQKEWGIAVYNPIQSIRLPRVDNSRDRRLEGDEEARILVELAPIKGRSPWMIPLVRLAIETAARQSELLALRWDDVNLEKRVIRVRGKEREDGKSRTKNREKWRDVPLSSTARHALATMPRSIGGRVFPVSSHVVQNAFTQAVKRAAIVDLTFHDLRHEATSRLADIFAMHELMKVTGHSSTRMLARYYHPRAEDLAKKLG